MFDSFSILFLICFTGFIIFWLGAITIWITKIRPFIKLHGYKYGSLLFQSSLLKDYRIAIEIAKTAGQKPKFLKAFSILAAIGISFFVCGLIAITLEGIYK